MNDTITITFERLHPVHGLLSARRYNNTLLINAAPAPDLALLALKEECVQEVEAVQRLLEANNQIQRHEVSSGMPGSFSGPEILDSPSTDVIRAVDGDKQTTGSSPK